MFEFISTIFNVLVSIFTPERVAIAACIIYGVYVLWILLSLLCSFQSKFSRGCRKISDLVDTYGLTSETYPKFVELGSKLPDSFLRGWKTFEHAEKGLPSEYIKRSDCLDLELEGGLLNQNRSTMRTYITGFSLFFALLGVANIGADVAITGYALASALLVPCLFSFVSMLTYYLYTAIRHHQYKVCVEDFNEMMDILNEKVEGAEIEFANRDQENSVFVQNVVEPKSNDQSKIILVEDKTEQFELENGTLEKASNDLFQEVGFENKEQSLETIDESVQEIVSDEEENNVQNNIVDSEAKPEIVEEKVEVVEQNEDKDMNQNTVVEPKRGRGRPRKEKTDDGELVIKTDEEFEEALARAEKLMKKNEEPLSASQQKRVEKALKDLVDAMKKYKGEK